MGRTSLRARRGSRGLHAVGALAVILTLGVPSGVALAAVPTSGASSAGPVQFPPTPVPTPGQVQQQAEAARQTQDPTATAAPAATQQETATPTADPTTPAQAQATTTAAKATTAAAPTTKVAAPVLPVGKTPEQLALAKQAAAAKAAAELASLTTKARSAWTKHDRPGRMIIVRATSIDIVVDGVLKNAVPRTNTVLTLPNLAAVVPATWLSISDGTARLSAAVVMNPGTSADFGGDVHDLKLTGSATLAGAASIYTGGGKLTLHGITVSSSDRDTHNAMPAGPGRPFISVSQGGRFDATDSTIADLGTLPTTPNTQPGLLFNPGSTGSLVRVTVQRNSSGLKLAASRGVRLDTVTVTDSVADGLALDGDRGTTLKAIQLQRNGRNGLLVTGPSTDRPITGISTTGNALFGVAVVGQTKPQISGIVTTADKRGGLRLNHTADAHVSDFTATDEPIGVYTHVQTTGVVLDKLQITGGQRGVLFEKTTTGVQLTGSTIANPKLVGVNIGGKQVTMHDVTVSDARSGVRIERGADTVTVTGLTVSGGQDGIVATPGSTNVVIKDIVVTNVGNDAIRSASWNAQITGGQISGGSTAIDVEAAATISAMAISASKQGIRSQSPDLVHADNVDITAIAIGITVDPGRPFLLSNSHVHALEAVRGQLTQEGVNDLSLPPLNLLAVTGVPLILLAFVLEQVHAFRQRRIGGGRRRLPRMLPAGAG